MTTIIKRLTALSACAALALLCAAGCSDDSSSPKDSGKDALSDLSPGEGLSPDAPKLDGPKPDGPSPDGPTPDGADSGGGDAIAVTCPPPAPYGTAKGDRLPNLTLKDCAGNNHDIHDLCGKKASWIFIFRGS